MDGLRLRRVKNINTLRKVEGCVLLRSEFVGGGKGRYLKMQRRKTLSSVSVGFEDGGAVAIPFLVFCVPNDEG